MPDFTETPGQDMQQKTVDELFSSQDHSFFPVIVGPVQIGKGDIIFINSFNPVIRDRDLVCVTCQIFNHKIRIFERLFGMYYPIGFVELFLQLPEVVILFEVADLPSRVSLLVL